MVAGVSHDARGAARHDRGDVDAARRPRRDSPIVVVARARHGRPVRVARQLHRAKGSLARSGLRAERQWNDRSVKKLVVTADDFGLSSEVNEAVRRAHRDGILTCASLMMGAPAAKEAVAIAKMDGLPVGLHLTLVDGHPCCRPTAFLTSSMLEERSGPAWAARRCDSGYLRERDRRLGRNA